MIITPFVWDALPIGRDNAMSANVVAAIVGLKTRQDLSREVIREHEHGFPICSNGHGYYRPANDAELEAYINSRKRRAKSTAAGTAQLIRILRKGGELQ